MKQRKPRAKLVVRDANMDIVTENDNFTKAFLGLYNDVIEYHDNAEVTEVDPASMRVTTTQGTTTGADVVNLIPWQRVGALVAQTGLANATESRFAAENVLDYTGTLAPRVHVIGDASATTQPKAGHIANEEAKVCADAMIRAFAGLPLDTAPVTNRRVTPRSRCARHPGSRPFSSTNRSTAPWWRPPPVRPRRSAGTETTSRRWASGSAP